MNTGPSSTAAPPAASTVEPRADGKFLSVGGRRFFVKGVSYGTFAPDATGAQFPPPAQTAEDFRLIAAAGFNAVRTYTVPNEALLDEAARHDLRVLVGVPWPQHVAFLDDHALVRQIRHDTISTVRALGHHPAALMFAVGNEIPPSVVRWHGAQRIERFLRELYDEAKAASPHSLLTYVNFPPTEYLDLSVFDVCAFNVYLHRDRDLRAYLARLQHIAGPKPLLLAEAGADSIREGADGQARITAMHIRTAFAEGACGAVAFAWTDEWWRGGHDVTDWAFGLVDAARQPKPALAAVADAFREAPFAPAQQGAWPKVSVVVCAYNAADTIEECLQSLGALTYPDFEVIVVNDGSRDTTGTIARSHPRVKVIDIPNGGLAAARNVGLAEATGEIVAYTDADVRVDPDWLTYLVQPFVTSDVVGAGGPNIVPGDDPWVAQCVARAPGGPVHVLLDDRIAEHVPGCNMAFRRDALLSIGGFNPTFLRAGDDVDICWRLQAKGLRIGFAPSALVWHHHRATVGAYWRQQVGYGEGEAWLVSHHPEKFARGDMLWRGRIYTPLPFVRSFTGSRVNTGVWGTAAFPSVYHSTARLMPFLPHAPAWLVVSTALLAAGLVGLLAPLRGAAWLLLALGAIGWGTTLARCVVFARRTDLRGVKGSDEAAPPRSQAWTRLLIAWLHLLQPVARLRGRIRGVWTRAEIAPPSLSRADALTITSFSDVRAAIRQLLGGVAEAAFWSEEWIARPAFLSDLAAALRRDGRSSVVDLDDGWRPDRDLSVGIGRWGWLQARVLVEEHAQGRSLLRVGTRVRPSLGGSVRALALAIPLLMASSAALALGWPFLSLLSVLTAVGVAVRAVWESAGATAAFRASLARVAATSGFIALAHEPSVQAAPSRRLIGAASGVQLAIIAMLVASVGLGGVSMARAAWTSRGEDAADISSLTERLPTAGGVTVGVSGDLFVAEDGIIARLRPRPPHDAAWTANDIGTDVSPLLGDPVPFEYVADIALAQDGDIYVADAQNHRVARVERTSGRIVTVAGSGDGDFDGDGGPADLAALNSPGAVAVSANGDLYIADTLNDRVRMVEARTGTIRTVAGGGKIVSDSGPARDASLSRPAGLAVAPDGSVFISDTGHNRVLRLDVKAGMLRSIAGDGTTGPHGDGGLAIRAGLAAPMGLALVAHGDGLTVYVADSENDRVRAIDATGRISTLVGPGRVVTPVRLAYHPGGWLYVKDASPDGVTAVAAAPPLHAVLRRSQ